jgi:hypothetical protein
MSAKPWRCTNSQERTVQLSRSKARVAPWNPRMPAEIQTTSRRDSMAPEAKNA